MIRKLRREEKYPSVFLSEVREHAAEVDARYAKEEFCADCIHVGMLLFLVLSIYFSLYTGALRL